MCDNIDPYMLSIGTDATTDADFLPATTYPDIYNYLVLSTNYATQDEMRMVKSLEAHNFFTSGWVRGLAAKQLPSKRVVVLSQVNHSQRLRDPQLKVWVLAEANGTIVAAHCTCMAGLGEACSHIGATLFAVETAVRIRDARTCTEKTNVWLPAHNSRAQYKRLKDRFLVFPTKKETNGEHGS
ncbi:hypothetical protein HPB48_018162 [Haemaphysalis longicornis]|uniref:SWIM-type domain-containing protein n=1 Tax=Haemaphysalis longicornis TaxID=44386 RepID=A0A9J6FTM2_HAELO|nr:hypothetical protein HPB48_018162 [Haemaphysalis longicornis]